MAYEKMHTYKIRWREQAQPYQESLIKAHSEREALEKLRKTAILDYGIGSYYLWVIWTMDCSVNECMLTKRMYIKRMYDILG